MPWDSCLECDCKLSCEAWNEWNTCQWQNRESTSTETREPSAGRCQRWREDLDLGGKFWRRALWYSDTQSTWLEAILPTCSKKARKRFDYDFCAPSQSQSSLALSRPLWLLARCRWDSSNHAFSPWCPKKTHRNLSPKRPNVTNATPLHNSKIGWGFHTTLLRCKVGKFQLTNPSAKLWQNENCDFPTSDLQETRWAFAQFRLPLNLRLQHPKRLELPLPLFYSKRLIQWLDLTICHFVEMNGYIQQLNDYSMICHFTKPGC